MIGDAMHAIDLGVAARLCGNIMFEVMEAAGSGTIQAERAAVLAEKLKAHYTRKKDKHNISGKVT